MLNVCVQRATCSVLVLCVTHVGAPDGAQTDSVEIVGAASRRALSSRCRRILAEGRSIKRREPLLGRHLRLFQQRMPDGGLRGEAQAPGRRDG